MNAKLCNLTAYRFGPYRLTGPRLSKPGIKAIQSLASGVRAGKVGEDVLVNVSVAMGHKIEKLVQSVKAG